MKKSESGSAATSLVIGVLSLLLVGALIFGLTAYQGKKSATQNTDRKIAVAVSAAEDTQKTALEAQFADQEKSPYKTLIGSSTFGSVTFQYPNSWSGYVDQTNNSEPINAYFNPNVVPGVQSGTAFALRAELTTTAYSSVMQPYTSQAAQGKVTAVAYVPPKMKGVNNVQTGTLLTGAIQQNGPTPFQGEMLVIPVRDKTLQIYTLSNDYLNDFNNIVLASLTFVP